MTSRKMKSGNAAVAGSLSDRINKQKQNNSVEPSAALHWLTLAQGQTTISRLQVHQYCRESDGLANSQSPLLSTFHLRPQHQGWSLDCEQTKLQTENPQEQTWAKCASHTHTHRMSALYKHTSSRNILL